MLTSDEDAIRLFDKWMSERSPLSLMLSHEGINLFTIGQIEKASSSGIVLVGTINNLVVFQLDISFEGVTFEYLDSRATPPAFGNIFLGSRAIGCLELSLPSGAKCLVTELDLQKRE